ncbi:MAG: AAA family ATPase, partial [Desulfarculus sp.]|nr:AAA family ATPase [Desulfarculus sp.]
MAKTRQNFVCLQCGAHSPKWLGRCPQCQSWDSLAPQEEPAPSRTGAEPPPQPQPLGQAGAAAEPRIPTGLDELDRVLGGGLVPGMVVLVGGEPGIGKSTLMLQLAASLSQAGVNPLYVSAEESAR